MADVLERDAGFCSGGDEDDVEAEDGIHSPTDASEDSVDVKVRAISLRNKNKRKCAEPRRLDADLPAKKRKIGLSSGEKPERVGEPAATEIPDPGPFRPWSSSPVSRRRDEPPSFPPSTNRVPLPFEPPDIYYPRAGIPSEYGILYLPELSSPRSRPSLLAPGPLPRVPVPFRPRDLTALVSDVSAFVPSPYDRRIPSFSGNHFQEEPLSLVSKKKGDREDENEDEVDVDVEDDEDPRKVAPSFDPGLRPEKSTGSNPVEEESRGEETDRIPSSWHSPVVDFSSKNHSDSEDRNGPGSGETRRKHGDSKRPRTISEKSKREENCVVQSDSKFRIDNLLSCVKSETGSSSCCSSSTTTVTTTAATSSGKPSQGGQQRNYKNMTRERRIEANARERTRVHTISAAFDTLRHVIPAYSHNQKLSKLSVLRIACSYIMTLSRLAGYDYSKDQTEPDVSECVDNVSKTIQTEGKIRKKKED